MHPSPIRIQPSLAIVVLFLATLTLAACEMRLQIPSTTDAPNIPKYEFEATGEDYLVSALEELQAIADWSQFYRNGPSSNLSDNITTLPKMTLAKTAADTVYIFGQIIPGGYGAVVTERYARPKGLLLITVRKTYGKANGHIVTETKRYVSYSDHRNDSPQQTNVTEMYGLQADTIVAHVLRNGTLETYTFRLPVVTRVVNPEDGSIRVTKRYASNGAIVSKVEDANGNLVQLSRNYGQSDGSTVTRTEYPDGSWRQVRTHGEADGTVTRETTSGLPSLGSGCPTPANVPRPVMSMWMPARSTGNLHGTNTGEFMRDFLFLASGVMPAPTPPRPRCTRSDGTSFLSIARGQSISGNIPRPGRVNRIPGTCDNAQRAISGDADLSRTSVASGISPIPTVIPRPVISLRKLRTSRFEFRSTITDASPSCLPSLASGAGPAPNPPRPVMALFIPGPGSAKHRPAGAEASASGNDLLCSGLAITSPRPPRPVVA